MKDYSGRRWLYAVFCAGAIAVLTFFSMRAGVLGLFHDDGVYAITARSIAAGTGYRIVSLPGSPRQTKYPILYPYLLSWVWRVSPTFPANVLPLKSVNALSAFAVMLLGYSLFRRHTGLAGVSALAYLFLVGTNLMLMSVADFTLSDNLFQVFVMASLLLHDDQPGGRLSGWAWGAVTVSLGFLTRASGVSLIVAGVLSTLILRSRRDACIYAGIVAGLTLPWLVWRFAAPAVTNPLVAYYTGYETPAFALLRSHPRQAWQIVSGNARYLLEAFDVGLLLCIFPVVRWLVYALVLLGSYVLIRRRPVFLVLFVAVYTAAVLNYPFVPGRYVMPLLPIAVLVLFTGVFEAQAQLVALAGVRVDRPLIVGFGAVPIAVLMALNLLWLRSYLRPSHDDSVRGFLGSRLTYSWSGFTETFEWVQNHTRDDEVLATPYDPMYYLYTGRKGVRPWFHQPDTYFYPVGHAVPNLGDPATIRDALNDLGVRYLIIDPLDGYAERVAAPQFFGQLLAAYPIKPQLVFTSHDSAHKIYDLHPLLDHAVR